MTAFGTRQYLRVANVKVFNKQGIGRDYTGLRCRFRVEKTSESGANKAKLQIYNLNSDSRTFIEGEDVSVELSGGYPGAIEILATGEVVSPGKAISTQKNPDWITTIEFSDGQKALRESTVNLSFAPGTPFQAIITQAIKSLGVSQGPSLFAVSATAIDGFSFSGTAKALLDKLTKRFGLDWSIQNGAVQVAPQGTPVPGIAILISSTTGLIGSIVKREKTIEFKHLINGELAPGKLLTVDTPTVTGAYKIRKVIFDGDSYEGPWFAEVEAEPLA